MQKEEHLQVEDIQLPRYALQYQINKQVIYKAKLEAQVLLYGGRFIERPDCFTPLPP